MKLVKDVETKSSKEMLFSLEKKGTRETLWLSTPAWKEAIAKRVSASSPEKPVTGQEHMAQPAPAEVQTGHQEEFFHCKGGSALEWTAHGSGLTIPEGVQEVTGSVPVLCCSLQGGWSKTWSWSYFPI